MKLFKILFVLLFWVSFSSTVIAGDSYFEAAKIAEQIGQHKEAFLLYLKSAEEEGNVEAGFKVAVEYRHGWHSTPDKQKAVTWYHWAAERGSCLAQWSLGDIYSFGSLDLEKDDVEGHKWYLMAAEQNTTEGCCLWSTKIIGDNYYYGSGVTRDIEEAVRWYRRAAYAGWTRSQLELGVMLRDGINVRQDYTEAVMLFRAAAESGKNGDPNGKLYLGEMYEQGKGVLQDYLEAVKWYQDSGSQGNYWAQKNLAHMYRDGLGVEQDLGEAYVWYSIAAVDEDEWQNFEATKQRDLIAKLLDPKSRNELQEKTKELYEFIETRRYHGLD